MNFDFTDDQRSIKSTAKEFLAARYKPEKRRELAEAGEYDPAIWDEMRELGWAGIFIDEEHEGQGLGVVELVGITLTLAAAVSLYPFVGTLASESIDVPGPIDMASFYVPPEVGETVIGEVARKQIPEVWLNPGAEPVTVAATNQLQSHENPAIAADPNGRLWVGWEKNGRLFVRRSNLDVTRWGRAVSFKPPGGTVSIFDIKLSAQNGLVDVVALLADERGQEGDHHPLHRSLPQLQV